MTIEEVQASVLQIITDVIRIDKTSIELTAELKADLGFDSLDDVELIMALEEEYGIVIDDVEVEDIKTVQQCIDFMITKLGVTT